MQEITLKLTKEQLQVIDQCLQQAPYYVVKPIIDNINLQLQTTDKVQE